VSANEAKTGDSTRLLSHPWDSCNFKKRIKLAIFGTFLPNSGLCVVYIQRFRDNTFAFQASGERETFMIRTKIVLIFQDPLSFKIEVNGLVLKDKWQQQ
jgi:hypothetical protein